MTARPGKYNKRMAIYRRQLGTPSDSGEQSYSDVKLGEMWCALLPQTGSESQTADQVRAQRDFIIRTWYRSDLTIDSTLVLTLGTRRFEIESVLDVEEAHEELEIRAHEFP